MSFMQARQKQNPIETYRYGYFFELSSDSEIAPAKVEKHEFHEFQFFEIFNETKQGYQLLTTLKSLFEICL